jgi:hypothetical protein
MPPRKGASNTQGRRARDDEDDEDAVMDDELAEQVDGLEIDDEAPLGGKAGRKGPSGAILSEQVRIAHAHLSTSSDLRTSSVQRKSNAKQAH